jgi:hypothetical protein
MKLTDLLHSMPCLWDVTCLDYRNRTNKKDGMQSTANEFVVTNNEMEKKIHSLKTKFPKQHKKLADSKRNDCSTKHVVGLDVSRFSSYVKQKCHGKAEVLLTI